MSADRSIRVLGYAHTDLPFEFCGGVPIQSGKGRSSGQRTEPRCERTDAAVRPSYANRSEKRSGSSSPVA